MKEVQSLLDRFLPKGGLKRSVFILSGGTVLAQAIAFAVSPILTRLYLVEDFGYLQVFNSIVSVLLVVVAGRYEMAVPLPEDDDTAVNLLAFALCTVLAVCSLTGAVILFGHGQPWVIAKIGRLSAYLWLIPICLAGAGFYQVFSYWSLRKKEFSLIAGTRVIQVASRFLLQLAAALLKFGLPGLLVGETIARANGTGSFVRGFYRRNSHLLKRVNWKDMWHAARRYKHFPLVFSASGLFMSATLAVPSFLLVGFFGPTVTGWFALVDRVLRIPALLIGQSLQQVYISEGAKLAQSDPVGLKRLFIKITKKIFMVPIVTCVFLVIFAPALFAFVFGENWREAGQYARILGFVDVVALLAAPTEMTLAMLELQNWRLAWDLGRLLLVTGSMIGVHYFLPGARAVIAAYAASMMLSYAALLAMCYIAINGHVASRTTDATSVEQINVNCSD